MLKVMPAIKANIERLSTAARNRNNLNSYDSRMLHVVPEEQINEPEKFIRYNIRQADGSIKKITLFEKFIKEEILQKIKAGYQRISSREIDI